MLNTDLAAYQPVDQLYLWWLGTPQRATLVDFIDRPFLKLQRVKLFA